MNLSRVFELFPCLLLAKQNKTKGMKQLLLEFVDENITSLHFSHCEIIRNWGYNRNMLGFGRFSHVSGTKKSCIGPSAP